MKKEESVLRAEEERIESGESDIQNVETNEENTKNGETEGEKKKKPKRRHPRRGRYAGMSAAATAVFLLLILLVNGIANVLVERYPSLNLDLTAHHANTLSGEAAKAVDSVNRQTTISIMVDENLAKTDTLLAEYGIHYSQVSALAEKAAERNRNIRVEYIDLDKNPAFASKYKEEGLMTADVLVHTEQRHRILPYTELFQIQQLDTGETAAFSTVDGALASALLSVNAEELPLAVFDVGHSEMLDTAQYEALLKNNQFETETCNLLTDPIPPETQLLVLAAPYTDLTKEEIEKIDAFLNDTTKSKDRSLMLTFDIGQVEMPNLSAYLAEWGMRVEPYQVLEGDAGQFYTDPSEIFASINRENSFTLPGDYAYLLMPQVRAVTRIFESRGEISTYNLATASDQSYGRSFDREGEKHTKPGKNTLAAYAQKAVLTVDGGEANAHVIAFGSSFLFVDGIINTNTFGDRSFVLDVSKNAVGTDGTQDLIEITPVRTTVFDITMGAAVSNWIGLGVFMIAIPAAIAITGILVTVRRRRR